MLSYTLASSACQSSSVGQRRNGGARVSV